MADRTRLIPTPTVDRNGRTTTVYRRPASSTEGRKAVPSPEGTAVQVREELVANLTRSVIKLVAGVSEKNSGEKIRATLGGYSTPFLKYLSSAALGNSDGVATSTAHYICKGTDGTTLGNALHFAERLEQGEVWSVMPLVKSLEYYPELAGSQREYRTAKQSHSDRVVALMRATVFTEQYCGDKTRRFIDYAVEGVEVIPVLKDSRLVSLLVTQPEDIDRILSVIRQRESADYDLIMDTVSNPAAILHGGIL